MVLPQCGHSYKFHICESGLLSSLAKMTGGSLARDLRSHVWLPGTCSACAAPSGCSPCAASISQHQRTSPQFIISFYDSVQTQRSSELQLGAPQAGRRNGWRGKAAPIPGLRHHHAAAVPFQRAGVRSGTVESHLPRRRQPLSFTSARHPYRSVQCRCARGHCRPTGPRCSIAQVAQTKGRGGGQEAVSH